MADATLNKTLQGHTSQVQSVAFSPDNKIIASASYHTVRLWNIPNGDLNAELKGHEGAVLQVFSVAFSPDGKSIVMGSLDKTVRIWSVTTKQQIKILNGHSNSVQSVAWSPYGDLIASGSSDKTVILWDAISGSVKNKLTTTGRYYGSEYYAFPRSASVLFSQNGNKLASAGYDDKTAIIWDVNSGAVLIKLAHSYVVLSICFSPDDQFFVTGCHDGIVRIFNANTGREEKRFEGHTDEVRSVAISFDGSIITSGSNDHSVRLWDVASTKQLQHLHEHTGFVFSVAFSRDGTFIASGSRDNTVCLWNAPSSLQTPTSLLKSACFAGDVDSAKFQLDQGALVNNKDGSTALYAASNKGSKQLVELLVERGADINLRENSGSSALHTASYQGHKEVVEFLIVNGADIKTRDSSQNTALHIASLNGQAQVLSYLLDCGLSINDKGNGGSTALHLASSRGHKQVVDLLIKRHADPSIYDDDQTGALNAKGYNGFTALHHASLQGDLQFVELLIKRGANINLCNADQNTALHLAYLNNNMDVFVYLLHHGSLVDEKGQDGSTILHLASRQGNQQVIELLIEKGADANSRDHDLNDAFYYASMNDHLDLAQYLLLRCSSLVNEKTADGSTLLHKAVDKKDIEFVRLLLQRGADVNIVDGSNQSALQLANQSRSAEIKAAFNQAINLQNKSLKSIPASALNQPARFTLRLGNNKLGSDVWGTLTSSSACKKFLVCLFLQFNPSLGTIPDSVAKLGQLLCLSVADCGLSASSIRDLALLPSLRSLNVSGNQLGDLSAEFSQLKEVRILNVNKCNLSLVPAAIMQLLQLHDLDIGNNPIHRIPVALASLKYLTRITLSGCPLTAIPSEYHNAPTSKLLQFLKDLGEEPQPVYRSKLLLVGYGGVGKTTLLSTLFPPSAILLKKKKRNSVNMKSMRANPWEQRWCLIEGNKLVYERPTRTGGWEKADEIELVGAMIEADETDQVSWFIQPKGQSRKYKFRCQTGLEREEWINACKFQALNRATDGITVMYRDISHADLQSAFDQGYVAPANWENANRVPGYTTLNRAREEANPMPTYFTLQALNRVPEDSTLQLALCDFAGQHEYQDGHQLFLTSRSVYLVLWDVTPTPTKRAAELAKLRHWLVTLQLQLGNDQLRNSVLIYIIGTHADAPGVDLDQCAKQATKVIEAVKLSVPHRMIAGIDVRNQQDVSSLKQQLLADLAVQTHLGEEVPTSYLDLEHQLRVAQDQHRLQSTKQSTPLLQRSDLALQLKVDVDLVTRGLSLLHLWGQIVYLGEVNSRSKLGEVVVYLPEWLTVSVLGSLVAELRRHLGRALDDDYSVPVVKHADLVRFSSVWMSMSSEQREQVMEMLYAFDLGFPLDESATKSFEDRSSLFPQLLPLKPPRSFTWIRSNTSETARIVELNGIPMGFHTVLLSRLRSYFGGIDSSSSWRSGFVFTQDQVCTLVTIHEDSSRLRFCVRNGQNVAKFFSDLIDVLRQILTDRYKGLRIVNEFVECSCEGCRSERRWQWNDTIANAVANRACINSLLEDTTARSELSAAILLEIQPKGPPFLFNLADVADLAAKRAPSGLCQKYKNAVPLAELLSTVVIERQGNDVFISYRRDGGSDLSLHIKSKLTEKGFKVFHDVGHDGLSAGLFDQTLVNNLKSSRCVVLLLTKGSLNRCLDGADPNNNDWVRREIATAIANKILIIPVVSNFEWPSKERLPEDIRELVSYNAVEWSHSYSAAAINKITGFIDGISFASKAKDEVVQAGLKVHEIPRHELTKDTKLNEGNFGTVWRGTYNDIPVAIKQPKLRGSELNPKKQLADLIEEATVMTSISAHPNVLHCYGISRVGEDDYLLVTELCNLGSLDAFLRAYSLISAVDRRQFSQQVARGLNHLGEHNIVHRDVAARNVLLHDQGGGVIVAKVCDFGLSRLLEGEYHVLSGDHLLSPETAPEVFTTGKHSSRSDIWSFGVLLWEVESLCATRAKPNKSAFPPLPKPAQASDNIYEIMLKCWAIDPHQRPSFEVLVDLLD